MSGSLEHLFGSHPRLQAVLGMVLAGRAGSVVTTAGDPPRAARLDFGCYAAPGGDPDAPGARDLVANLRGPLEIVVPDDDRWRNLILEVWGGRVQDRAMRSYLPGPDLAGRCMTLATEIPAGYELRLLDADLAGRIGPEISPHGVTVLGGPASYTAQAPGRVLLAGDTVACAATIYALTDTSAEIAIATGPDHRGRGLAACASASLVGDCLERGLEPHWNAFNPVSQRLAERLGFAFVGMCEILMLVGDEGMQPDGT